ncbi:DNA-binding protein WhiA [Fusobacterium sp. PH5-44]|uniref:DNA-binding protein WhiA n=1 Tax=unclassified Fusobacterium TaxID=2648384 RepID=UPI003D254E2E
MSFTSKVKKSILENTNISDKEKLVELSGIFMGKNALNENQILLNIENLQIAKRVYSFLKDLTSMKIGIKYSTSKKLGTHKVFTILIERQQKFKDFYDSLKITTDKLLKNEHLLNSYIRGIFLACGYVKDPKNEYSLDFFIDTKEAAENLQYLFIKTNKRSAHTIKRNKELVYLRNSEDIMDILVMIGATHEFFTYEEITIIKELKNKTIREMNWELANETKTLNTANNQIKMINYIGKKLGLNNLTPVLEEVAFIRLQNPESSLQEIAELIGISKSGVRNRFKRIEEVYENLLFENGDSGD